MEIVSAWVFARRQLKVVDWEEWAVGEFDDWRDVKQWKIQFLPAEN